jgi:hypothetical protein
MSEDIAYALETFGGMVVILSLAFVVAVLGIEGFRAIWKSIMKKIGRLG